MTNTISRQCNEPIYSKRSWLSRRCSKAAKYDLDSKGTPTTCWIHSSDCAEKKEVDRKRKQECYGQNAERKSKFQERCKATVVEALKTMNDEQVEALYALAEYRLHDAIRTEQQARTREG